MAASANPTKAAFETIYASHSWGSESRSGPGSIPAATESYRQVIQNILATEQPLSILDVGCGDWASSKLIEWGNIPYHGVDIVASLTETLNNHYGTPTIRFSCLDVTTEDVPVADLLIIKDVMQHWSNSQIKRFLQQLKQFRLAIITNDCSRLNRRRRFGIPLPASRPKSNTEIAAGGYRPLELTKAPFYLDAETILKFSVCYGPIDDEKEVLLWRNPSPSPSV